MSATHAAPVKTLAETALAALRGHVQAPGSWRRTVGTLAISHHGPALPVTIPGEVADHQAVAAQEPTWTPAHRLRIHAPLAVLDLAWNEGEAPRILYYSRGDWEQALCPDLTPATGADMASDGPVRGTIWRREQGLKDALLREVLRENGFETVPLFGNETPEIAEKKRNTYAFGSRRDGPVAAERRPPGDEDATAAAIKAKARTLGADLVGIARIRPEMVDLGVECPHRLVVCIGVHERYDRVVQGPRAVEAETYGVYHDCARIATELADHIRALGYPALAHHNGGTCIQAIPAMHAAGFGELGRHGSLINRAFGASFRPSFVTTDLPMACDAPDEFGVQDYCLNCNLCTNNCPGGAIPKDYIMTGGHRRWLTDMEKCYPYSRLAPDYCHLCVDVCPYIHKENRAEETRALYKAFMRQQKERGYGTPKRAAG